MYIKVVLRQRSLLLKHFVTLITRIVRVVVDLHVLGQSERRHQHFFTQVTFVRIGVIFNVLPTGPDTDG